MVAPARASELRDFRGRSNIAEKPWVRRSRKAGVYRDACERLEQLKAKVGARVEHPFRVIDLQFGYTRARYWGIAKNAPQVMTLFALSNLWMARRRMLAATG